MSSVTPTSVDARRPIEVFSYPPTPDHTNPFLPDFLIDLLLAERQVEPQHNQLACSSCGHIYHTQGLKGMNCTWCDSGGWTRCGGVITARWTRESVYAHCLNQMRKGEVAVAWQHPAVPIGFSVCECHGPDTLCEALDMPVDLGAIYGVLGRDGPYLVITHLWMGDVAPSQALSLIKRFIDGAVEPQMRRLGLSEAPIIVPVDSNEFELRHSRLREWLAGKGLYRPFARDRREGRRRMLLGFKLRAR